MIANYSNRKTNNSNNINSLFKIFIEVAKYTDQESLQIQDFFRMFLDFNIYIYKFYDLTEYEIHKLDLLFPICPNMFWNVKNYYIANLDDYKIYANFDAKRLDSNQLYNLNLISYEDKTFIDNLIKSYNCRYPDTSYDCLYVKVIEGKPFYIFCTNITRNKSLIKHFTKNSYLFNDSFLDNYRQIVDNFKEGNKKWISRYFVQLPRKIVDNDLVTNLLMIRVASYYNYTNRKFMSAIHIENFGNSDFETIKNRTPIHSIHFNVVNKNELYKIIETMNDNLSCMNYSYKESANNVFIADYHIELKYTYNDVLEFLKQLMLASYIMHL